MIQCPLGSLKFGELELQLCEELPLQAIVDLQLRPELKVDTVKVYHLTTHLLHSTSLPAL